MEGTRTKQTELQVLEITLSVPGLKTNATVGGGCCVVPVDFLIEETLDELDQVRQIIVSESDGLVRVSVAGGAAQGLLDELMGRIEDLGYNVLDSRVVAQS